MERNRKAGFSGATAQTLYAYVDDNPGRVSDPLGLYISWDCVAERTTEWSTSFPKNPQNIKDGIDYVCVYSVKCEAIEPFLGVLIKGEGFWIRYMGTTKPCACDKYCVFSFTGWPVTVKGQELFVPSGPPICSNLGPGFI
jgi:hypothetical protein